MIDLKKFNQSPPGFHPSLFDNTTLGQPLPPFNTSSQVNPIAPGINHIQANIPMSTPNNKKQFPWI